jgi:hypothetical protein
MCASSSRTVKSARKIMAGKSIIVFMVLACFVLYMSEVESAGIVLGIPPEALNSIFKKVESAFTCSKYDGFAGNQKLLNMDI